MGQKLTSPATRYGNRLVGPCKSFEFPLLPANAELVATKPAAVSGLLRHHGRYRYRTHRNPNPHHVFSDLATTMEVPPAASPVLASTTSATPAIFGLNSPFCSNLRIDKYLSVPWIKQPLPKPTSKIGAFFVCSVSRRAGVASMASNLLMATPRAMNPNPVRDQARKVRSLARWSRATLPVLAMGMGRRNLNQCGIVAWAWDSSKSFGCYGGWIHDSLDREVADPCPIATGRLHNSGLHVL